MQKDVSDIRAQWNNLLHIFNNNDMVAAEPAF